MPTDEQLLANLDAKLPALKVFLAAAELRKTSPELLAGFPEDLRIRLQKGDPSVLPELLKAQPKAFRNELLGRLEDEAFRQLLASDG